MQIVYFTHSLLSCWNHGNAHFLRGVLRNLQSRGHSVRALEPAGNWSRTNLLADQGQSAIDSFATHYPDLRSADYAADADPASLTNGADIVIVHEWTDPALIAAIGRLRSNGARFRLLFHDTHHRGVSDPAALRALDLSGYDAVLAFGETLASVYRSWGWGDRVFVWHEAADTTLFHPIPDITPHGIVWVGNWGDGERGAELTEYLLEPARRLGVPFDVHGVRYPPEALAALAESGVKYRGWIANARVPAAFAAHRATLHVPRRYYTTLLPGIPTIRVFEALACGIPLVCAPWDDAEHLFRPDDDYLIAANGAAMHDHLRALMHDDDLCAALARSGLETILARHTCAHRVDELLAILARLETPALQPAS